MKLRKKVIKTEEETTQDDIYASFTKDEHINSTSNATDYQYPEKEKDHYLENNSTLTASSKASRSLLYGFYLLIIIIGIIIFFLFRADRYSFYLVKDEVNISNGGSYQVELTPKYAQYFDYLNYDYKIENESIAKVDEFGTVTAVGNGTTTLKISLSPGFTSKKMRIISDINSIENISLLVYKNSKLQKDSRITMEVNETITLKAIANEDDKSFVDVKYSSSDESIAMVDEFGNVTAKSVGEVAIKGVKNSVSGEISIIVIKKETPTVPTTTSNKITKVSIGTNQVTKYVGDTVALSYTTSPKNIKAKSVTWTSSNSKVATVTSSGVVKALKKGTAVITVNVDGVQDTCTIIVKEKVTNTPTTTPTPTVPIGTQVSAKEVTLSKTSLTVDKGKTGTFDIKVSGAAGLINVSSSNSNVAKVSVSNSDCNGLQCFFDAQTGKESSITYTVTGVSAGTAYINVSLNDLVSYDDKNITGTGKIGILVK